MTRLEYDNTVRDLLGVDRTVAQQRLPPENTVDGFENDAQSHQASTLLVEGYMDAAETLAATAVRTRLSELAPCAENEQPAHCGARFVRSLGRRAFRRPLSADEVAVFDELFTGGLDQHDYATAVRMTLEAMLQSPQFLYRLHRSAEPTSSHVVALSPHALAARLSYFLWDSMPDSELLGAAEAGELSSPRQVEAQARRMLDHPRAQRMTAQFHRQWLRLDELDVAARRIPESMSLDSSTLSTAWRNSAQAYLTHIFWEAGGSVEALFSSPKVFVNEPLAQLYDTEAPSSGFAVTEAPANERSGLVTQPALMALLAHPDQSSPVRRGVFIRERLLCDGVPPPPPSVNATAPDPDPDATTRERFAEHTADPSCRSCHELIDGVGFGFEHYDHLGRFRQQENGLAIDASGELVSPSRDPELAGPFDGGVELARRMAASPQVRNCLALHWYRYALGRVPGDADSCSLDSVRRQFAESGGDLRELLVAIATSDAFRFRAATEGEDQP